MALLSHSHSYSSTELTSCNVSSNTQEYQELLVSIMAEEASSRYLKCTSLLYSSLNPHMLSSHMISAASDLFSETIREYGRLNISVPANIKQFAHMLHSYIQESALTCEREEFATMCEWIRCACLAGKPEWAGRAWALIVKDVNCLPAPSEYFPWPNLIFHPDLPDSILTDLASSNYFSEIVQHAIRSGCHNLIRKRWESYDNLDPYISSVLYFLCHDTPHVIGSTPWIQKYLFLALSDETYMNNIQQAIQLTISSLVRDDVIPSLLFFLGTDSDTDSLMQLLAWEYVNDTISNPICYRWILTIPATCIISLCKATSLEIATFLPISMTASHPALLNAILNEYACASRAEAVHVVNHAFNNAIHKQIPHISIFRALLVHKSLAPYIPSHTFIRIIHSWIRRGGHLHTDRPVQQVICSILAADKIKCRMLLRDVCKHGDADNIKYMITMLPRYIDKCTLYEWELSIIPHLSPRQQRLLTTSIVENQGSAWPLLSRIAQHSVRETMYDTVILFLRHTELLPPFTMSSLISDVCRGTLYPGMILEKMVETCCIQEYKMVVTSDLCSVPFAHLPPIAAIHYLQILATHIRLFPHLFTVAPSFHPTFIIPVNSISAEDIFINFMTDWIYVACFTHTHHGSAILQWLAASCLTPNKVFLQIPVVLSTVNLGKNPMYSTVRYNLSPLLKPIYTKVIL